MCTQTGYCRTHGVDHEVWGDGPMTCERAQEIRARLTVHAPTQAERELFWSDEPVERASGNATRGQEGRSGSETSGCTPAASSAGREPHSGAGRVTGPTAPSAPPVTHCKPHTTRAERAANE